ncbi:hypoxanthine-guanine phosphoribosyltransferase [Methylophaga sp.]|uniref:hypoxanthine-guanine phosphoribosyltransferase n=1 Tax=Methylophaga sp. TaxID=2024840 RepID=UPI003A8CAACE
MNQVMQQAECLFTLQAIDESLEQLASQLNQEYMDKNPVLLCVMNGAVMTMGHLLPKLQFSLETDYIHATRYGDKTVGGALHWRAKPNIELKGRHVLLVDDIYDEGVTLAALRKFCQQAGATSVKAVVLADKQHTNKHGPQPEYIGLQIPDRYVFGFGMDYKGYLRNAPGIYAVQENAS